MVGQRVLVPSIGVRVPIPEPEFAKAASGLWPISNIGLTKRRVEPKFIFVYLQVSCFSV